MATRTTTPRRSESVNKAGNLSAQGKDKQALEVIQKYLRQAPRDIEALNLAGTLAARMENWERAEHFFTGVLALSKDNSYALYSLSKVYKLSNRGGDAVEALTRLLQIEPGNVAALNEIGVLLAGQGHLDPALQAFKTAIDLDPAFEKAYRNLYATLYTGARYEEAADIAKRAFEHISSDYRWNFRTDLILCLWKSQAFAEARELAEDVIEELEHSDTPAHKEILLHAITNLGVLLLEMQEPDAAEAQFKRAIALAPNKVEPYVNLAKLNVYREDFQGAIAWFEKALAIDPEHAELHNHLAIFLRDSGRPDLALPHHLSALAQSPGNVEMRFYLGITQFALGRLQEAYANWALRWSRREGGSKSTFPIPEWTGTSEAGRSLLVYREQGIGDEIIFASCLPDLSRRFERILCVCHSKLKPLFARSFPYIEFRSGADALTAADLATLEWQIPIGSLPPIVRPDVSAFPPHPQLLSPDPLALEHFRAALAPRRQVLTVGIGWRSGLLSLSRRTLYPYLEFWRALFDIPGITWVNVQYGEVSKELREAEQQFGVSIVNFDEVDHFNDLDTSAALMKACDLVIGPDTSTTQIAAAVGTPTIRMYSGCDYFCLGTDHYPWFPSLTTIPRHFGESWLGPIDRTASIIKALVAERSRLKANTAQNPAENLG
jgi:Flp pilus assembly protein TadD